MSALHLNKLAVPIDTSDNLGDYHESGPDDNLQMRNDENEVIPQREAD